MIGFTDQTSENAIGIRVDGEIETKDFSAMADLLREAIGKHGKIRLVLELEEVGKISPTTLWEELKLAFDHFDDVERIALVGDALWQEAYVKVVGALLPAEMRRFASNHLDHAWRWIRS